MNQQTGADEQGAKIKTIATIIGGLLAGVLALGGGTVYLTQGGSGAKHGGEHSGNERGGHGGLSGQALLQALNKQESLVKGEQYVLARVDAITKRQDNIRAALDRIMERCAEGAVRDSHLQQDLQRLEQTVHELQQLLIAHISDFPAGVPRTKTGQFPPLPQSNTGLPTPP